MKKKYTTAYYIGPIYNKVRFLVCIVLSVLGGIVSAMKQDQELKLLFDRFLNEYQQQLRYIPSNFDQNAHGRIIQCDAHDGFNVVVTVLGGMYRSHGDTWLQIHANECESEQQFFNEILATHKNTKFIECLKAGIEKRKFNLYNYDPVTNILMYPTHRVQQYQRAPWIKIGRWNNVYPKRIIFECDPSKVTCNYDIQLEDNAGNVQQCVRNNTGTYYAIAGFSSLVYTGAPSKHNYYVKILKKISDSAFGDDPNDLLTQGDQQTKVFTLKADAPGECLNIRFGKYEYGDHVHMLTNTGNIISYWIISPIYGKTIYKACIDCGNEKILPFEAVNSFVTLKRSLSKSKPRMCVRGKLAAYIAVALKNTSFPPELQKKIVYDYIHIDERIIKDTYLVYGTDDAIFPKEQKKALIFFNDFDTAMQKCGSFSQTDVFARLQEYSDPALLWNALHHGRHWGEIKSSTYACELSHILLKYVFSKALPKRKKISIQNDFWLQQKRDGTLNLFKDGHISKIQNCLAERYNLLLDTRENWGTKQDVEQYAYDKTVKKLRKNSRTNTYYVVYNDDTETRLSLHI